MAELVRCDAPGIDAVAAAIEAGGVVIVPTDTTYGFFGSAQDRGAVERVYAIKSRDRRKPFVVHTNGGQVERWAVVTPSARRLIDALWPGPLCLVLPRTSAIPDWFTAGLPSVGVLANRNRLSAALLARLDVPLFTTTLNYSGEPEVRTFEDARRFAPHVDVVMDGDDLLVTHVPSTMIDCTTEPPAAIRIAATPVEDLLGIVPDLQVDLSRRIG